MQSARPGLSQLVTAQQRVRKNPSSDPSGWTTSIELCASSSYTRLAQMSLRRQDGFGPVRRTEICKLHLPQACKPQWVFPFDV